MPAKSKLKSIVVVGCKVIGVLILVAGVAGFVYETIGRRNDSRRLPRIGQAVDIGGRTLNIFCSGAGSPAVILDSGAGYPGYEWIGIQPEIARFDRACWFDRAGEGWSDPGPFPRTSAATARDLHLLLGRAGIGPPYVLVGHSLGGLNARVYQSLFPTEVAGMVLVDAAHEDEPRRAPPMYLGRTLSRKWWRTLDLVVHALSRVGVVRLMAAPFALPADPARRTAEQITRALQSTPKALTTMMSDATAPASYDEARASGNLGDRPLIVLTRGRPPTPSGDAEVDRQIAAYHDVWVNELQAQLARLSTRGRQIVVPESGHMIPLEAPQRVIDAVRDVVAMVRRPQ